LKKLVVLLVLSLVCAGSDSLAKRKDAAKPPSRSKKAPLPKPKAKASKKRRLAQVRESVPEGVATEFPAKKWVDPGGIAQTRMATATALPSVTRVKKFFANINMSYGTIDRDIVTGDQNIVFATLQPLLRYDLASRFSVYGTIPLSWYALSNTGENIRTMGRPELGAFTTLINSDFWILGAGISVLLPFFDTSWGMGIAERKRRWQVAPGATLDMQILDTDYRLLASARALFESNSSFTGVSAPNGELLAMTMTHAPALRFSLGLGRDYEWGRAGMALHAHNGLSASRISDGVQIREEMGAASVLSGEIFGNYSLNDQTLISASLTSALRNDIHKSLLLWMDSPRDTANLSLNLGLNRSF
jgi:hypothetical protein